MISPGDRFKVVLAVHLVLREGDKILLGRRQNTGWADGKFHLFGGHAEPNELALKTLRREAEEELGVKIALDSTELKHVRSILSPDHTRLHLYFVISKWSGEIALKEPELCSELKWFDINDLPDDITRDSREAIANIEKNNYYSQTDRDD
ncbi:MAG: hypothetical protein A3H72_03430 [Candidatus Doudnabacteria bacterium RIFCSPLOWO2_02_FULL_48_8]|uniref:Nudix hydrolase domain-containing protein n=1 Tax=Candidatus Doudnabacteria bacterium RIFCSPHIGHO2_01_FULL_46_24 TaxID=1817825 RepID=A0A1F5NU19_9BACT|nr:MAG: hypothetical protein A2720_01295 [Candidatus Doudnabacteria bacterium RIFCSPHIGHO2_01_FULL_46_24]OGE95527.1 MAG: hypothetical protein A3H72_03430 [Candidatus Doudnabacteria bacterium RIFCSPLOWO2_02_FULL_48_8]OGE96111.1 MAG: hypothetical protein A3E98_02365 [Candidatus Doudnabacteria bacterium RIFCSPHIGHO2_12_FULL_48_11]